MLEHTQRPHAMAGIDRDEGGSHDCGSTTLGEERGQEVGPGSIRGSVAAESGWTQAVLYGTFLRPHDDGAGRGHVIFMIQAPRWLLDVCLCVFLSAARNNPRGIARCRAMCGCLGGWQVLVNVRAGSLAVGRC